MVAPTNAVCGYTHPASLLGLRVFTEKTIIAAAMLVGYGYEI